MGGFWVIAIICILLGILIMWMSAKSAPQKRNYDKSSKTPANDGSGAIEGCGCTLFVVGIFFIFLLILTYYYG